MLIRTLFFAFLLTLFTSQSFAVVGIEESPKRIKSEMATILQLPFLKNSIILSIELLLTNSPWDSQYYVTFLNDYVYDNCKKGPNYNVIGKMKVITTYELEENIASKIFGPTYKYSARLSDSGPKCVEKKTLTTSDHEEFSSFDKK